jgi:hypothetical protein
MASVKIHFDEHPLLAVARRDVNLGLKFDRKERLTFGVARLRVHAGRKELAESQGVTRLTPPRPPYAKTWNHLDLGSPRANEAPGD